MRLQGWFRGILSLTFGLMAALPAAAALPKSWVADASFTTLHGQTKTLSAYRHHKLMVWEVATWCGSCVAGLQAMQQHALELEMSGVTVILLQVYQDDGYNGIPMRQFVRRFAPGLLKMPNWIIGTANADFSKIYNPEHYADIYYLFDTNGQVSTVSSAPGATFATIKKFMDKN